MKCLFVTAHEHYHQLGGGGTATRALKARFDDILGVGNVELCCFEPWGENLPRRLKQVFSIGKSLFSNLPSRTIFVLPADARQRLSEQIARVQPDLVVINGGDIWLVVEAVPKGLPMALIAHNIEHRLMQGQVDKLAGVEALLRPILQRDVNKLRTLEIATARSAGNVLSISTEDAVYFDELNNTMNVKAFLPTFDYPRYEREIGPRGRPLNVGFMAKMSWWPNQEGAEWFVEEVLAHLDPAQVVGHFFGIGSEAFGGRLPNLVAHGFVDVLEEVWQTCDLMICPILSGSGVNIKFAEALYNRMPILATSLAARGIASIEDDSVVSLDQASEWVEFLSSPKAMDLAERVVSTRVADLFQPESQRQQIVDFLKTVMSRDR